MVLRNMDLSLCVALMHKSPVFRSNAIQWVGTLFPHSTVVVLQVVELQRKWEGAILPDGKFLCSKLEAVCSLGSVCVEWTIVQLIYFCSLCLHQNALPVLFRD